MGKKIDIIGKKFGKLTVFQENKERDKQGKIWYYCMCDCGNTSVIDGYNSINGKSTDCGCGRKEKLSELTKKSLVGMNFGKLKVISELESRKNRKVCYLCECDCGNIIEVVGGSLLNNHTTSCGCIKSKANEITIQYLLSKNICFETEKTFKDCNNLSFLKFDVYIPSNNLILELDGEQHFKPIDFFGGEETFATQVLRDGIKNSYCNDNGILLFRIPVVDTKNLNTILKNIMKHHNDCERLNEKGFSLLGNYAKVWTMDII